MFKLDLEKAGKPEVKLLTSIGSLKEQESFKNMCFYFTDYAKAFDYVDHKKTWKILQEIWIPDHLTCLLRNLYAGQEATVRTGHGIMDWSKIGKGVCQGNELSPCFFKLLCRVHHVKCWAGWLKSCNQYCWEKYQQLQISRWYHFNGRKQRGTKEPLEGERGEWKNLA